jgi:hypothetical protein
MGKKLITASLAVVALAAFILPASASAATVTHPTGTAMATGKLIEGTQIGISTIWNPGHTINLLECSKATLTGTLTANAPEPKGNITSATFEGTGGIKDGRPECTGDIGSSSVDTNIGNGVPWCLTLTSSTTFSLRGNSCTSASRSITFVITSTIAGTCKYNRTTAVTGTVKNDISPNNSDVIASVTAGSGTEWLLEEGGFFCPTALQLEMSFTLETDGAAEPLYVS